MVLQKQSVFFWCSILLLCVFSTQTLFAQEELTVESLEEEVFFEAIHTAQSLTIAQEITGTIQIPSQYVSAMDWIKTTLHLYPKQTYRQQILFEETNPFATSQDDSPLEFLFTQPFQEQRTFTHSSVVQTQRGGVPITQRVAYPITLLPLEVEEYLRYTELIDTNEAITQKAQELASDYDDLFDVAHAVAFWVRDSIAYNLSTITVQASNPATWVFENRIGVCDELTTLYISLMRSLGIPARYVTGFAYTTSDLFAQPWVAHAWAEVYFPDFGWVPFDLTYGQFGYVDATHIQFTTGVDGSTSATSYAWQTRTHDQVSLNLSRLQFTQEVRESQGVVQNPIQVTAQPVYTQVGYHSKNAIAVTVQNNHAQYHSVLLRFQTPSQVQVATVEKPVLLKPFETQTVYVPLEILDDFLDGYVYTVPIQVFDGYEWLTLSFSVSSTNPSYTKDQLLEYIQNIADESAHVLPQNVLFECTPTSYEVFIIENTTITCRVHHTQDETIFTQVCLSDMCQSVELAYNQSEQFTFSFQPQQLGIHFIKLQIQIADELIQSQVQLFGKDRPSLHIRSVTPRQYVTYTDTIQAWFILDKTSFSPAQSTRIQAGRTLPRFVDVGYVHSSQNISLTISPYQLRPGVNHHPIFVWYSDDDGKLYFFEDSIEIVLEHVTLWQRIKLLFARVFL